MTTLKTYRPLLLWVALILALALGVLLAPSSVREAWAQTFTVSNKQFNSLVADGATASSSGSTTSFGQVLAGYDGTNFQHLRSTVDGYIEVAVGGGGSFGVAADDDSAFVHGTGDVTPAGFIYDDTLSNDPEENDVALGRIDSKRAMVSRIEGETRGVSSDVLTLGADDTANTTNGVFTYSALLGYESVGGVWDRLRMDTSGNLYTTLATALDSSIDSISIAVNDVTPQLDSTDRMAVSAYFFNAAAGDTQPTATTTQADNLANTLDTLNVSSFLYAMDSSSTWDRLYAVSAAQAEAQDFDAVGGGVASLSVSALMRLYDSASTNYDLWHGTVTNADDLAVLTNFNAAAVGSYELAYDVTGTNWDRVRGSQIDGFYTPDAASSLVITANGGEDCTADNALTAGTKYIVQSDGRLPCVMGADAATIAADASDMPIESPGLYYWRATSTTDTICCVAAAGTITVHITPVAFN